MKAAGGIARAVPVALACLGALAAAGCGAGQYGFSKIYKPLDDEKAYDAASTEYVYEDVNSDPAAYEGKQIAWFGKVKSVVATDDGRYRIALAHHQHQPRHLCDSDADDSCRVTVHKESAGQFSALVKLRPEDTVPGLDKVQPGSLMRVFGTVRCRLNDEEKQECDHDESGGVLLDAVYYRQWPARYFVTTAASGEMRR
jgi:hypothetical protein